LQGGCFVWRLDSNHVLVLSTCTSHRTDAAWVLYRILKIKKELEGIESATSSKSPPTKETWNNYIRVLDFCGVNRILLKSDGGCLLIDESLSGLMLFL
jgi:hypothetical protein